MKQEKATVWAGLYIRKNGMCGREDMYDLPEKLCDTLE
jgi:hypothetical protein